MVKLFDGMTDGDVEELLVRLTEYARKLIRKAIWRGDPNEPPPGGVEAQDIVYDVVLKYEDGTRQLNPQVDLHGNLMGGVRSGVSALIQRHENHDEAQGAAEDYEARGEQSNPELLSIYNEETTRVYDRLLASALGDDNMMAAVDLFESRGEYTAGELGRALGLDENEAKALRRRFSRALDDAIGSSEEEAAHV